MLQYSKNMSLCCVKVKTSLDRHSELRKLVIGSCLTRVRIYDGLRSAFEFMDLAERFDS
jgi:hypothetical protein